MQKDFQLTVDIENKIRTPSFEVNTLDLKTVRLQITIIQGMSLVDLTGITVRMSIQKPDKNVLFQDCKVVNAKAGLVEIVLDNQAYLLPGKYNAELMCFQGAEVVAVTGSFSYTSSKGILTDEAVESKSEFTAITGKIKEVEDVVTDLRENGTGIDAQARRDVQDVSIQVDLRINQSVLFGSFLKKLNTRQPTTICLFGDSVLYGADYNSTNARGPLSGTTDNGALFKDNRASLTPSEGLSSFLNEIYSEVSVIQKAFPGDGTKLGWEHWNASTSDLVIFNYGINDAIRAGTGYAGDLSTYIRYYRLLIERELRNGTAVMILTPTKQKMVASDLTRQTVDTFSETAKLLASDYNIPVIDGAELMNNYNADIYSDYTHFNGTGYGILASRLAAAIIGKSVNRPHKVNSGSVMSVIPQSSSLAVANGEWINNAGSPTSGEVVADKGVSCQIGNNGSLIWSFYAEQDGLVAFPTLQVVNKDVPFKAKVELDFGTSQAQWGNYWQFADSGGVNTNYREPSRMELSNGDFKGYSGAVYDKYTIESDSQKVLKITNKGWHTVKITFNSEETNRLYINNLSFTSLDDYKNRVYKKIPVEYLSGEPINGTSEQLYLIITNQGEARLTGTVKNATISNTIPFAQIDNRYAPEYMVNYVCGVSNAQSLTQANVMIKPDGGIYLLYSTSAARAAILEGCVWHYEIYK